jgi:single-stranded DNA-binding protein
MPNHFLLEFEGHLGKDPVFKPTANEKPSCYFSVAVTKKGAKKDGGKADDKTVWLNVTAYGYAVEQCRSLSRGMPVLIRTDDPTALRAYKSTGNDGQEYINLAVSTFVVLPILWKGKAAGEPERQPSQPPAATPADESDDLPF